MTFRLIIPIILLCALSSCFSDKMKQQMDDGLKQSIEMLADRDFKMAIGNIEIHKLRYGVYPNSLNQLKFVGTIDSSSLSSVSYLKLDSGYELNLQMKYVNLQGESNEVVKIKYPEEFWQGLGCVKSNLKK